MNRALRLDLHVHSRFSPDSRTPLEAYAERIAAAGVDGFAVTDHNSVAGLSQLESLRARFPDALFVPGVELSTREGHLLAYGVDRLPPPGGGIEAVIDWVAGRGGVAVPAHPFRWSHGVGRRVAASVAVPALEGVNGHNAPRANARALALASARRLGTTGGSDCHDPSGFGRAVTVFPAGVASVAGVLDALGRGRTRAEGRSLPFGERVALTFGTAGRRAARGFRPI